MTEAAAPAPVSPPEPARLDWKDPLFPVLGLFVLAFLITGPWGNFPLNDDWTYAHLAKHWAETGVIKVDVPIAPNGIGQGLIGAAFVKVFGFSHQLLRYITFVLGCFTLWALNRMLRPVLTGRLERGIVLGILALNPLFFYSSASFMNELWGWGPAFLVAAFWFIGRHKNPEAFQPVRMWMVAVLSGAMFWTRQHAVVIFPAFLGAWALLELMQKQWKKLGIAALWLIPGLALYVATIVSFFPWAKSTDNYRPEFAARIENLYRFDANTWVMQAGAAFAYLTLMFLPLLVLIALRTRRHWAWMLGSLGFFLLLQGARAKFVDQAPSDFWVGPNWGHKVFPWSVNIIWNAGIGPMTFDDTFFFDAPKPSWPKGVWLTIESVLLFAGTLWGPVFAQTVKVIRSSASRLQRELTAFSALLVLGSLVVLVQAHQGEVVDRYFLPLVLGAALWLGALLPSKVPPTPRLKLREQRRWQYAAALGLPVALFTVLGVHDQFRWNEARWTLGDHALQQGGTPSTVQGGWEMNCWYRHEGTARGEGCAPSGCRCAYTGFCCVDDTWRLGLTVSPGFSQVEAIQPSYWLASGPPVILSRRPQQ